MLFATGDTVIDASGTGFGIVGVGWTLRLYYPSPLTYITGTESIRTMGRFNAANDTAVTAEPLLADGVAIGDADGVYWHAEQTYPITIYAVAFYEDP